MAHDQRQTNGGSPQQAMSADGGADAGAHAADGSLAASSASDADAAAARQRRGGRVGMTVLAVVAVIAVVCAVAGFVLYARAAVPSDAAAKVNDDYIAESDVSEWIAQYRVAYGLEDDDDLASALASQDMSVSEFRMGAIDQIATNMLVDERAEELGVTPTDEEVQAEVDAEKESYAFGDENTWVDTLDMYGMTEEGLFGQCRTNLAKTTLFAEDVERRDATDDEAVSYARYYLADTTQKHIFRIVFTGDDEHDRASACLDQLRALQEAGDLDAETFAEVARAQSDEADVEDTGGSYAWTGDGVMDDDILEIVEYLDVGELSDLESIEGDDAIEILYCDEAYSFPPSDEIDDLSAEDLPATLLVTVANAASDELWSADCNSYLAQLLAQARMTYYPVPDDAPYNVDVSSAS